MIKAGTDCGVRVHHVVASAESLPFRTNVVDVVLCLETLEHLENPNRACVEMMRVLVSRGQAMVTTASRVRFLFRRDPHRAVPGLLLLPDRLQKFVVDRVLRNPRPYDVTHMYWTARAIVRLFPERARAEIMISTPWPPPPRDIAGLFQLLVHHVRKQLRNILWDRIVVYKR